MRRLILPVLALVAGILVGCGDPAPSVPLAPDTKMPDTSKMSPEEIQKLHQAGSAGGSDRGQAPAAGGAAHGDTPADRGG
jgi:hypothetical protein